MLIAKFIEQAIGHVSAEKLINNNRDWLGSFPRLRETLAGYDARMPGFLPTQALHKILAILPREKDKAQVVKIAKVSTPNMVELTAGVRGKKVKSSPALRTAEVKKTPKNYQVTLYRRSALTDIGMLTSVDVIESDSRDFYGDAERHAYNRLFSAPVHSFAIIEGHGQVTRILRETKFGGGRSAMAVILAPRLGGKQSSVGMGRRNAELGSKMSVRNDVCKFSYG